MAKYPISTDFGVSEKLVGQFDPVLLTDHEYMVFIWFSCIFVSFLARKSQNTFFPIFSLVHENVHIKPKFLALGPIRIDSSGF